MKTEYIAFAVAFGLAFWGASYLATRARENQFMMLSLDLPALRSQISSLALSGAFGDRGEGASE